MLQQTIGRGWKSIVPIQLGDDLAHGLGSSGGGGDDVLGGTTSVPPHLTRGTINGLLRGGGGVDCALEGQQQNVMSGDGVMIYVSEPEL